MTDREYKQPGVVRKYFPDERGAGIAGYMHHLNSLLQQFRDAVAYAADRMAPPSPTPYGPPINVQARLALQQWLPMIGAWEPELLRSAELLRLESEIKPLTEAARTAIAEFEPAAKRFEEQRSRYFADHRQPRSSTRRRKRNRTRHPDLRAIRRRLAAAEAMADQIESYWVRLDPAKPRIDRAAVPWDRFRDVAVDVDYDIYETISGRKPDTFERNQEVEKHRRVFDEGLYGLRHQAVIHALNDELGSKINTACQRVLDAGRDTLRDGASASAFGEGDWIKRWTTLNEAVLALQDLEALFRRAVREARLEAQCGEPPPVPPLSGTEKRPRIVLDAERTTATLDGTTWPLTPDSYAALKAILDGRGQWVGADQIRLVRRMARPDRAVARLPPPIRAVIESRQGAGGGYRIDPNRLGTIGP